MSFLVDPPLLVATGAAIEAIGPDDRTKGIAEKAAVAVFVGFSVGLYFETRWSAWMPRMLRTEGGRDWMINSKVTRFEWKDPPASTHAISAAIFATYPLWARAGRNLAKRALR